MRFLGLTCDLFGACLLHAGVTHGNNEWVPTPRKQHRYLIEAMPPEQVGKVTEALPLEPPRSA